MSPNVFPVSWIAIGICLLMASSGVEAALPPGAPPAAKVKIDFAKHIKPILKNHCGRCHSGHSRKGGFSIDQHESFVKGGESGGTVIVGQSAKSLIIQLVTSTDSDQRMPMKNKPLSAGQIGLQ